MAFGNEWEEEMKLAFENGGDPEKLLQLYIFDHLKKKNLHDVAEMFAQKANLEESQLVGSNENLLTEWWELFWPAYCSSQSNKAGANGQSSGQSSMVYAPGQLVAEPEASGNKHLGFLPSQALFHADNMQYIMPTSNCQSHLQLPAAMETSCQVTKVLKSDGLGRSDQMELTRHVGPNFAYTGIEHHAGLPAAQALGKGALGVPPVQFHTTQITPVPPLVNPSNLQMPFTIQPPPQVANAPIDDSFFGRSVQVETTYPGRQISTYSPAAPYAGEANWKNQLPLAGVTMGVPVQEASFTMGIRRGRTYIPNSDGNGTTN